MASNKITIHRNKVIEEEPFPVRTSLDEVEDGVVYGRPLKTSIQDGKIVLSAVIGSLDDVNDGTYYGRVAKTSIEAGKIILSEANGDIDDIDDGATYGKVLKTSILAGKIILSETDGDIDDIVDGTTYGKVLQTSLSAGKIVLSEIVGVGALASEDNLDGVPNGTNYGKVLNTSISAGKIVLSESIGNLADIANGGGYAKVNSTSVDSGGIVIMSQISGNLDDVGDGNSYKKISFSDLTNNRVDLDKLQDGGSSHLVSTTEKYGADRAYNGLNSSYEIIKGFVNSQLSSKSLPSNGVRIDSSGIYCTKSSVVKFYLDNNGDAYFEGTIAASTITGTTIVGGTIKTDNGTYPYAMMNSNGITIHGERLYFKTSGGISQGTIGGVGSNELRVAASNDLTLYANDDIWFWLSGSGDIKPLGTTYNLGTLTQFWGSVAATTYYFKRGGYAAKYIQMSADGNSIDCNHNFYVGGELSKISGSFKIDHPLKPKTHWLKHSFVESPEMLNIYRGVAEIKNGECEIKMPKWFIPLNGQNKKDYSYHLTSIGDQNDLWVKKEMDNQGKTVFAGDKDGKFSYLITGVRHDKWAEKNRIQVESLKI